MNGKKSRSVYRQAMLTVYIVFRNYGNPYAFLFQTFYRPGDYIIRQGARGDTFFIISKGQVSRETVTLVVQQFD
jgi:hypothetical protein